MTKSYFSNAHHLNTEISTIYHVLKPQLQPSHYSTRKMRSLIFMILEFGLNFKLNTKIGVKAHINNFAVADVEVKTEVEHKICLNHCREAFWLKSL